MRPVGCGLLGLALSLRAAVAVMLWVPAVITTPLSLVFLL